MIKIITPSSPFHSKHPVPLICVPALPSPSPPRQGRSVLGKRGHSLLHRLHAARLMFQARVHAHTRTFLSFTLLAALEHICPGKVSCRKQHWVLDQSAWAWLAVSCRSKWAIFPLRLDIIGSGGACAEGLAWAKLGRMGWETSMQHRFRSEHPLRYFGDFPPARKHCLKQ